MLTWLVCQQIADHAEITQIRVSGGSWRLALDQSKIHNLIFLTLVVLAMCFVEKMTLMR
jgi:hypothetical protein